MAAAAAATQRIVKELRQANCRAEILKAGQMREATAAASGRPDILAATFGDRWTALHQPGHGFCTTYFFSAGDVTARELERCGPTMPSTPHWWWRCGATLLGSASVRGAVRDGAADQDHPIADAQPVHRPAVDTRRRPCPARTAVDRVTQHPVTAIWTALSAWDRPGCWSAGSATPWCSCRCRIRLTRRG